MFYFQDLVEICLKKELIFCQIEKKLYFCSPFLA